MGFNVLSLFDGISCGRIALERAGISVDKYFASEIDKRAIEVSKYNYPDTIHIGDILSVDFTKYIDNVDIIIGGSPCFVAGTLIRTIDGLKTIEDIKVGDKVLTHKNRFKTVTTIMSRVAPSTVIVEAENCGEIECTKEHPFYTKEMNRVHNNDKRCYERVLSNDFSWTSPENFYKETGNSNAIKRQTYLTSVTDDIKEAVKYNGVDIKINQFSTKHMGNLNLNDERLWYIIGRWVGDGWYNYKYRVRKKLAGIKICCGKHEVEELEEKIRLTGLHYYKSEEKTVYKFIINNLELALYLKRFGDGAKNKHLSSETYRLPDNLALSFLNGYFDADGCVKGHIGGFSTVSKELAYGIKYMVNKYMGVSCSIIKETNHNMVGGRLVNVNDTYIGSFRLKQTKQSHYFVEDSYILAPYKSVTYLNEPKTVYNMSVEDDESYVANGLVVHNCTYWSIAKAGRETTPEGEGGKLFLKFKEAIDIIRPKYFLYENNYSISSRIKEFISESLGVPYIVINSALVSAQNRRRCYWTNIPGVVVPDDKCIFFRDILESGVVERSKSLTLLKSYSNYSGSQKLLVERDLVKCMHSGVFERVVTPVCLCRELVPIDDNKSNTLTTVVKDNLVLFRREDFSLEETDIHTGLIDGEYLVRPLTPVECERLQTLPDGWTELGLSLHYQNTYDIINQVIKGEQKCKNVRSKTATIQSAVNPQGYVTNIIYDLSDLAQQNLQKTLLKNANTVSLMDVITTNRQDVDIVLHTIKDLKEQGGQIYWIELLRNVNIAIEWQLEEECVVGTIKIGKDTVMQNIQIKLDKGQINMDIENLKEIIEFNTEKSLPNYLEENYLLKNWFITLIWINLIIIKKIYMSVMSSNTQVFINSSIELQENLLNLELSNLRMGNITSISKTQRYKQLGNGWTVDVIAHIFSFIPDKG